MCGWPLRNLILCAGAGAQAVACIRRAPEDCVLICVESDGAPAPGALKVTGWERNERGAVGPKTVDLSPLMDPKQ